MVTKQQRKGCRISAETNDSGRHEVRTIPDDVLMGFISENDHGAYSAFSVDGESIYTGISSRSRAAAAVKRHFESVSP